MKKMIGFLAIMLSLMMVLSFASAGSTVILFYNQAIMGDLGVCNLAAINDHVYISNVGGLYVSDQQGNIRRLFSASALEYPDAIVSNGNSLYIISFYDGIVREIMINGDSHDLGEALSLQYDELADHDGHLQSSYRPRAACMAGKWLCVFTASNTLLIFDIETGSYHQQEIQDLIWIASGHDTNSILMLQSGGEAMAESNGDRQVSLSDLDLENNTVNEAGRFYLPIEHDTQELPFTYDRDNQNLYVAVSSVLYRVSLENTTPMACAWLPVSVAGGLGLSPTPLCAIGDQKIAIVTELGIIMKNGSVNELPPTTLTLSAAMSDAYFENTTAQTTALNLPSLSIEQGETIESIEELFLTALSQSSDVDFFLLNTDHVPLQSMIEKGYLLNISRNSNQLTEWADALSPMVKSSVTKDGELYGMPIQLEINTWLARKDILTSLGLETPIDFISYCNFLTYWYENADGWDKWSPFPFQQNARHELLRIAYDLYVQYLRGSGQPINFDTPLFRKMMSSAMEVRFENDEGVANGGVEMEQMDDGMTFTFEVINHRASYSLDLEHTVSSPTGMTEYPFDMSADADVPAYHRGNLLVLAVNPYSDHIEEAITYLEEYALSMDAFSRYMLLANMPDEALPDPNYDRYVERAEDTLKIKQAAPVPTDINDKQVHEKELERLKELLHIVRENTRYILTEQEVQRIKDKLSRTYVRDATQSPEYSDNLLSLLERFASGSYPIDHFIREANSTIRLIEAEQ